MLRQIGLAIGVAVLIAILGTPRTPASVLHVYERSSWLVAALSLAGAVVGLALLTRSKLTREPVTVSPSGPAVVVERAQ